VDLQQEVGATQRPPHLLLLGETFTHHLVIVDEGRVDPFPRSVETRLIFRLVAKPGAF